MSDGGVGGGLSFWATFTIQGGPNGLTKEELKAVTQQIKDILGGATPNGKPIVGRLVTRARVTDNVGDDGAKPTLNIAYGPNK